MPSRIFREGIFLSEKEKKSLLSLLREEVPGVGNRLGATAGDLPHLLANKRRYLKIVILKMHHGL